MRTERFGWRAKIGVISPGGFTLQREWESRLPEGIITHQSLMELADNTPEALRQLKGKAVIEATKLARSEAIDMLLFACTSGSFIGGPGYDQEIISELEAVSGLPATTTATSVLTAFKDMGVKTMVMIGPYLDEVMDIEKRFFQDHGVETLYIKGMGYRHTAQYARLSEERYIYYRMAMQACQAAPEADVIFVTCMASAIGSIVDMLEQETGKPVVSSCSASLYGVLKKLGVREPVEGYGRLLKMPR
ncbi:MAG: hypothetical protein HYX91_00710 [Chloroflexi bacterium]|nr:hypothetical protein [Chloroflexota bacterium]